MEPRMPRQPRFDLTALVSAVVVENEMDVEPVQDASIDVAEESEEFLMAMAPLALVRIVPLAMSRAAKSVVVPPRPELA